ncbi:hypothetical protein [Hamadaea tsunoensis]|uniref:hypothetical protein n=1 Tax=Hamadaea tsunoensis TaxID=53368 RepID=UPI0004126C8A|nr:hypothetical protein [Hamadaea tsunoensis]
MSSDWSWDLHFADGQQPDDLLPRFVELAATYGLSASNSLGTVTICDTEGGPTFMPGLVSAYATGAQNIVLWLGEVDIFVSVAGDEGIVWYLNQAFAVRRPGPDAEPFRHLHALLTALWADAAGRFGAAYGRVNDEWCLEQIWELAGLPNDTVAEGEWPHWLGWWTYLRSPGRRPLPDLPFGLAVHDLPQGGQILQILDDPADVSEARFERIHHAWSAGSGR